MHWLIPILIYVPTAYIGVRWLGKHLADLPNQTQRLTIDMAIRALGAMIVAFFSGDLIFSVGAAFVLIVGIVNGIANVIQWRATRISLSKTSLLSFGDDIIAILLAMIFVGDGRFVNWMNGAGMLLCLATGILFWWHDKDKAVHESSGLYRKILWYSVLWGTVDFALRYFALDGMPIMQFTVWFYVGTLGVGVAVSVREIATGTGEKWKVLSLSEYATIAIFSFGIVVCLVIEYWARQLAPQTAVQPILLVAEAIVPTAVGLIVFKEARGFDREQWKFAALGITGVLLIALGF